MARGATGSDKLVASDWPLPSRWWRGANQGPAMRGNLYVSMSGQIALDKRLQTIASNMANINTAGYRADGVNFASVLSKTGDRPTSFVTTGTDYITRKQGGVTKTDNPLDVAIQGDAWFGIKTPDGTAYTRDGRFKVTPSGELQTLNGYPVLDAGGAGMLLETTGSAPVIGADGMITQNGNQIGAIGLFSIPDDAKLTRWDNSAVKPDVPATPVLDFSRTGVSQGFSEGSNVDPILEITRLIEVQRTFDGISNATRSSEDTTRDAIKTLGATS